MVANRRSAFVGVAILALALLVSACGGGSNPSPIGPSPTPPPVGGGGTSIAWSTVTGLNFVPSSVSVGQSLIIDVMFSDQQAGITAVVDLTITCPNGKVVKHSMTGVSTRVGVAAMGYGYWVEVAGTYSVSATVRQSASGQAGPEATLAGAFTGVQ